MTQPDLAAAVIARLIAEHVEEQPVDGVLVESFGQNLHPLLAVIAAVDARRIEAVVYHRLSIGLAEKPLRMSVEDCLSRLAQIEPSDDANPPRVSFPQNVAEHIAAGGQIGTGIMKLNRGRIVSGDSPHAHQHYICAHIRELFRQTARVEPGVCLPQVGLDPPNRLLHPPALLPALLRKGVVHQQTHGKIAAQVDISLRFHC